MLAGVRGQVVEPCTTLHVLQRTQFSQFSGSLLGASCSVVSGLIVTPIDGGTLVPPPDL